MGVSRPIYVAVDSPNLGFPYFNFLGGYQLKKHPLNILACDDVKYFVDLFFEHYDNDKVKIVPGFLEYCL